MRADPHPSATASAPPRATLRTLRLARLFLHLGWGLFFVGLFFPLVRPGRRLKFRQAWSRQALAILAIRVDADFDACRMGSLYVANHVSWLDILALNAARPMAFVSKAEVRGWPLLGWLAARNDTVFLRRGSRGHARLVNGEIDALLTQDRDVAVFPEGTTTDGRRLLNFHAALLQPAIESGRPIQPVSLAYLTADGSHCHAAAYVGEMTLLDSLRAILATPSMTVRLRPLRALDARQASRRELAQAAQAAIALSLGCPPPHTAPGTPPDPQA